MTTTTAPTADELREQIAEHQKAIEQAEQEIGARTLDGKSIAAPTKRAEEARTEISRCEAALAELERRETSKEEQERQAAASARRSASYRWCTEYAARCEAVVKAQGELEAAERALLALRGAPGGHKFMRDKLGGRYHDAESSDLDADALERAPVFPSRGRGDGPKPLLSSKVTLESLRELRDLAETRAVEEERGAGTDFSGLPSTRSRERAEWRAARRRERKAQTP